MTAWVTQLSGVAGDQADFCRRRGVEGCDAASEAGLYLPAEVVGDDLVFACGDAVEGECCDVRGVRLWQVRSR